MRSLPLIASLLALAAAGWSQEGGLSSSKSRVKHTADAAPVTCSEARKVFNQLQIALERTALLKPAKLSKLVPSEKAVTRVQVLDEVARLEQEFRPCYTLKPRTQYCNPAVIKFPAAERKKAIRLIKLGFIEPVAPLVVGPGESVTVPQFSEALGFFVERWSDMTHLPATKWSPDLQHHEVTPTPHGAPGEPVRSNASRQRA